MKMKILIIILFIMLIFQIPSQSSELPGEIGLKDALNLGFKKNLDIKIAIVRKYLSDDSINLSYSGLYPNLSLSSSFTRSTIKSSGTVNIEGIEFEVSDKTSSSNYSYGMNLSQWIFLPQDYLDIRRIADSNRKISILALQEQLQNIYFNLITKYFNHLKLMSLYELALEDLQTSRDHYNKTLKMFELGLTNKLSLSSAELTLQNKKFNLIQAENDLNLSKIEFLSLIGIPVDSDIKIIDDNLRFEADSIHTEENYEYALKHNISLNQRREQLNRARHSYKQAVHENLPTLYFNSGLSYSDNEFPTNDYRITGSISLNFNLFRGFQDKYNISMSRMERTENELELEKLEQEILLGMKEALANISVTESLLDLSSSRENMAKKDIDLAEARYASGLAIYLEVEDARISYIRAKSDRISSYYDHIMANISLLLSRGDFLSIIEETILKGN